jgi:hypothetical protein
MACGKEGAGACRWATVEVWLHEPAAVGGDVPCTTTDRQVCLRCGASRLVHSEDGRITGAAPFP